MSKLIAKDHGLYKYVYNGEIVYIGKSNSSIKQRVEQHCSESKFKDYLDSDVFVALLANSAETDAYEKLLINKYKPVLNVVDKHNSSSSLDFQEPQWTTYDDYIATKPVTEKRLKKEKDKKQKQKSIKDYTAKELIESLLIDLNSAADQYLNVEAINYIVSLIKKMRENGVKTKTVFFPYDNYILDDVIYKVCACWGSTNGLLANPITSACKRDKNGRITIRLKKRWSNQEDDFIEYLFKKNQQCDLERYCKILYPNDDGRIKDLLSEIINRKRWSQYDDRNWNADVHTFIEARIEVRKEKT